MGINHFNVLGLNLSLFRVEQGAMASIDRCCPRCGRRSSLRLVDLRDDGLGYKWVCNGFKGSLFNYEVDGCGWSQE